ncbi:hypothetical protein E4U41_002024 [Claviceps citrina]|nr:hypothetical protein E4U41_002024 [Claviceps citrina]
MNRCQNDDSILDKLLAERRVHRAAESCGGELHSDVSGDARFLKSKQRPLRPSISPTTTPMTPSPAALTIYAFGLTCLIAGMNMLLRQDLAGVSTTCRVADAGNSLAAIAMGVYYGLAACQENRLFFMATVPMRSLTTAVYWGLGRYKLALWEGCGALLTALALMAGPLERETTRKRDA